MYYMQTKIDNLDTSLLLKIQHSITVNHNLLHVFIFFTHTVISNILNYQITTLMFISLATNGAVLHIILVLSMFIQEQS